jgi:hypothetical protein
MGTFAEILIADYRYCLPIKKNKLPFSVFQQTNGSLPFFRLQQTIGSCRFR